ncbi:MAG TPA: PEP/pyruvate-binding domain-containing protein, partial [Polyangia bacterium]
LFPEDLVEGVNHLAHSPGEGYGTLRVIPAGQPLDDYGPRDVVIVQSAPNDISIVAGLITQNPQNDLGHVNLRLREKAIPNVTVPAIYQSAEIAALDGQLVHLVVSDTSFSLTATTLAKAQAFWDAHRPRVRPPVADLTVEALADFATLRATGAPAYGAKAANLGELTRVLAAPNRNDGFAIPFARYAAFAQATGIAAEVTAVLADPRLLTDRAFKRAQLAQLRARIRNAPFPPALLADIRAAATVAFGSADRGYLRFRSSTNVEDLDAFTGAGLYESRTGCLGDDAQPPQTPGPSACLTPAIEADLRARLATRRAELAAHPDRTWLGPIIADLEEDLTERKPVAGAVKKVWASLWEERAFDERAYYGIDHELAFMGIAVNPSFKVERASAVAVSNLTVDNGPPLYRLNSQIGSESVVRPEDPTAVAELLTFRRAGTPPEATDVRVQVRSNRVPATELVWPAPKLAELARLLFQVHDHFAAVVYPHIAPLALDFEIKHDADGNVVIKQVRPLVGQGTRP